MNTTERILTATTVLFVASTLYFAWALGVERDRGADVPTTRVAASGAPDGAAAGVADAEKYNVSKDVASAKSPGLLDRLGSLVGGGKKRPSREQQDELFQADFKRMYLDPVSRRQLIEERVPRFRDDYVVLERRLDLPSDRWQRFLEALASHSIEQGSSSAVCAGDTQCVMQKIGPEAHARYEQEIRDVLGEADMQEYQTFKYALTERQSVEALQAKLPVSQQLSEKTAEDLIAALSEVRRAEEQNIASEKGEFQTFSGDGYSVAFPLDIQSLDERLNYAAGHFRKLHERASSFLNPVQMAAYEGQIVETMRTLKRTMAAKPWLR
jgi:hypothetical protein